ncbi:MAG: hypothetical protein EPN88_16335 [Bacteroidetes bacterium]|nr:MAG: hypothetical protein EPN88_16335 [Bacteroidota bacterium]
MKSVKTIKKYLRRVKNKFYYFMLLFMITGKIHGQISDTIFVYDTIVVYDTIIVYDTVKITSNSNHAAKQAVLEFDTAASKAQLKVFNETDTATIPINSIIVDETNKNSQTMKKLNLTLAASALLTQMLSAQGAQESKTDTIPKYAISIGASYHTPWEIGYGGNVKMDYLITNKFGLGAKANVTTYKFKDRDLIFLKEKYDPGFYLVSDLTATYYLMGDYTNSKAGMYIDGGIGYHVEKVSSTLQYAGDPSPHKEIFIVRGLGGHASLGGSCKLGGGKIYLELMAGGILYGSFESQYPDSGNHFTTTDGMVGDGFMVLNLGYAFSF